MKKMNFDDAFTSLINSVKIKQNIITLPLIKAIGYIISEDIVCIRDLPAYNNSALDGYAIKYSDRGKKLKVKEKVLYAGVVTDEFLEDGECFKIMTGAKIPNGADTILCFEDAKIEDGYVVSPIDIKKGEAFRVKGEECKIGSILIKKGTKLEVSQIALLSSQGLSHIKVNAKPKVVVFSTGSELKEPYEVANEDEFYNINSYTIITLLKQFDIDADYGGIIKDSLLKTKELFESVKNRYDVIITSGGVSIGEADFVKEALIYNGFTSIFDSVNIKPGKPTVAGFINETLVISLPGNPLATFFNTFVFALPAIKKLGGDINFLHQKIKATNKKEFKVKNGRVNFVLGVYENGDFTVIDNGKISSGMVEPLLRSNAIALTNENVGNIAVGNYMDIYLYSYK